MRRRIVSVILVMVITLCLMTTASAINGNREFVGKVTHQVNDEPAELIDMRIEEHRGQSTNETSYTLWMHFTHPEYNPYGYPYFGFFSHVNGEENLHFSAYISTYCESMKYGKLVAISDTQRYIEYEVTAYGDTYKVSGYLTLEGSDPEVPIDIEKVISGVATSKSGEYLVSIGGKVKGKFTEGRNQIAASGQDITIFAMNTLNGATRIMNSNTINSMYVTVQNGAITKVEIMGRVQTSPGGFDTYDFVG